MRSLAAMPLVVSADGLIPDFLRGWFGPDYRRRMRIAAEIDSAHYGFELLSSGVLSGSMLVTQGIGEAVAEGLLPEARGLRTLRLVEDMGPPQCVLVGAFRRRDPETLAPGHPVSLLWEALARQNARIHSEIAPPRFREQPRRRDPTRLRGRVWSHVLAVSDRRRYTAPVLGGRTRHRVKAQLPGDGPAAGPRALPSARGQCSQRSRRRLPEATQGRRRRSVVLRYYTGPPTSGRGPTPGRRPRRSVEYMIEFQQLTKRYGDKTVVDALTFTVRPGVVTGFLGPNGAGKSTTMRLSTGLDAPTSGSVIVNGRHYADFPAPLAEVGMLLEARSVHPGRSAFQHLMALAHTTASRAAASRR